MCSTSFQIQFGGLCIGFSADFPVAIPGEFQPFLTEGSPVTDRFAIEVISSPIVPRGETLYMGRELAAYREEEGVQGGGSPWCGSSGIFSSESVPVAAIILLRQGEVNVITPADPKIAFREIYSQCIVHGWDRHFVDRVCDLIQGLLDRVPVYVLRCLPETAAALLTENTVFRKERGYIL